MRFVPESSNRQDWPRLVAQALNEAQRNIASLSGGVTSSGAFTLDDGTASATGGFVINDGGA